MNTKPSAPELTPEPLLTAMNIGAERASATILLVEDENFVREVTAEVLLFAGYRVLKARTAVEASAAFRGCRENVQLLLTDVVLPGRNGRALAADLRATHPGLKTIFISGYPENEITKHGLEEPGLFYLPKPFSVESLVKKVRQALEEEDRDAAEAEAGIKPKRAPDNV